MAQLEKRGEKSKGRHDRFLGLHESEGAMLAVFREGERVFWERDGAGVRKWRKGGPRRL